MKSIYPGFDKLESDSSAFYSLPLCDILKSLLKEKDFSYISSAFYPLEMVELILHYLECEKKVDRDALSAFAQKYLTEDSLCPIEMLLERWGGDKFNQMISELQVLAK